MYILCSLTDFFVFGFISHARVECIIFVICSSKLFMLVCFVFVECLVVGNLLMFFLG